MSRRQNSAIKDMTGGGGKEDREERHHDAAEKAQSIARMAHAIRTPLSVVMGLSEILAQSRPLTAEQEDYIETLRQSSESLKELVGRMLALCAGQDFSCEAVKGPAKERAGQ